MKISIISIIATIFFFDAHAQSNFYRIAGGAGYGLTTSQTDLPKSQTGQVFYLSADYSFTPKISVGIQYQNGNIKGTGRENNLDSRVFTNSFASAVLNAKYYLTGWFYMGTGVGLIHNTMVRIQRDAVSDSLSYFGNDVSNDLVIPLNAGFNHYFTDYAGMDRLGLHLNLQYNITLGEGLDGYDSAFTTFRNGRPDTYTYFSVGLSYRFGGMGITRSSY